MTLVRGAWSSMILPIRFIDAALSFSSTCCISVMVLLRQYCDMSYNTGNLTLALLGHVEFKG